MFTLRSSPIWLLAFCLVVLAASSTATAKKPKPPPDDPPPPPALYDVVWLDGLDDYAWTYANDINSAGTIVGQVMNPGPAARAVRWRVLGDGWMVEDLTDLVSDSLPDEGHLYSANCINNDGLIAGTYKDAEGVGHVYVCDPDVGDLWILDHDGPFSVHWSGIHDMNDDGTVVGYVTNEADIKQGFIWNYATGFLLLPDYYLLSGINNAGVVVGIVASENISAYGELFRWPVAWDDPGATAAEPLSASARLDAPFWGRPAISNNGTIAAMATIGRRDTEPRRLLSGSGQTWELLADGIDYTGSNVADINGQGQICGKLSVKKPPTGFHTGFVYDSQEEKFWILDDRIVHDDDGLWATGNDSNLDPTGPVLPRAVADESVLTVNGFSPIVGWQGPDSFVLVPGENPDYTPPSEE